MAVLAWTSCPHLRHLVDGIGTDLFFCLYLGFPSLVPLGLVMIVDGILLSLVLKAFWHRRPELALLLAAWVGQTGVLLIWAVGLTPSDAFMDRRWGVAWNPWGLVMDSRLLECLMAAFWYATLCILTAVVLGCLLRGGLLRGHRKKWGGGTTWRLATVLVMIFVLTRMFGDAHEFHRMGASLADSTSPDGDRQVRLVPICTFCDVNGVLVFRNAGWRLWWPFEDPVGNYLTGNTNNVHFVWDNNSEVRLFVGDHASGPFDLDAGGFNLEKLRELERKKKGGTSPK
jgi:hypothetical protein